MREEETALFWGVRYVFWERFEQGMRARRAAGGVSIACFRDFFSRKEEERERGKKKSRRLSVVPASGTFFCSINFFLVAA